MSNISLDISRLAAILLRIDSYMIIILYITGVGGASLNIITFLQKQLRRNSCANYFLSGSIVDFCLMNITLLLDIIITYDKIPSNRIYLTRVWCKLGNYLTFILTCLSSCFIILASVDRFCASSLNQTLRKCSRLKVSRIVIGLVLAVWILFGLHILIAYDYIRDPISNVTRCTVQTSSATAFVVIDGYFFSLFNGAIAPFLLSVFGMTIIYNVRMSRRRVTTQAENDIQLSRRSIANRQHIHMIKMLLAQVLLTVILNIPYVVIYLLGFYQSIPVDPLALFLLIVFSYIGRWFYYMNYCKNFYVNTLTSTLFRNSLWKQFHVFFRYELPIFTRVGVQFSRNN
ncbi:unnamed protein product [Adineta ricciae]|uniref:G-protein coupled receptors family 1 profile domain-containing protein n=1 Tax=Adineta ricciae TaxID=249248 RepID=A0A813QV18_ADIRI|nr:unnamed protein product [Adineta ricciae]CAF1026618.1 unnamed protein product [Adineta ricciae]